MWWVVLDVSGDQTKGRVWENVKITAQMQLFSKTITQSYHIMADIICDQSLIKQWNMVPLKCCYIKLYYLSSDATGNKTESELGEKKKKTRLSFVSKSAEQN